MQSEYHIRFPRTRNMIDNINLAFSIGNMKCRTYAVVYFILHCYDNHSDEILVANKPVYISKRWVVDESYSSYVEEFSVSDDILDDCAFTQIELVTINVDDDNPLYLTQIMLTDRPFVAYHAPNEAVNVSTIDLVNNSYADLYITNQEGKYLQVIRPNKNSFTSKRLTKNDITVLAPHLPNEPETDKSSNLLVEFLNQREQTTTIDVDGYIE